MRGAARLFLFASLPYFAVVGAFALAGSGTDMIRWTLVMPFEMTGLMESGPPGFFPIAMLSLAFLPAIVESRTAPAGPDREGARWLLLVAAGFAAMVVPRFQTLQAVAAFPCSP